MESAIKRGGSRPITHALRTSRARIVALSPRRVHALFSGDGAVHARRDARTGIPPAVTLARNVAARAAPSSRPTSRLAGPLHRAHSAATTAPPPLHFEEVILTNTRTTDMAHALWRAVLREGDVAVDATAGNGWDTLTLANLVLGDDDADPRREGRVVAFDVQSPALDATRARLDAELSPARASRVQLVLASHADMEHHVFPGDANDGDGDGDGDGVGVGVVCFNLGYLPGVGSDKSVVTAPESTLEAARAATRLLRPGGVLTIVGYTGHDGGREEVDAVMRLVSELDPASSPPPRTLSSIATTARSSSPCAERRRGSVPVRDEATIRLASVARIRIDHHGMNSRHE